MRDEIHEAIKRVINTWSLSEPVDFVVEHPADLSHGDYASNVALVLGGKLGKAPREIAEQLAEELKGQIPQVQHITIAGPGFLNFHLGRDFFQEKLTTILQNPELWGRNASLLGEEIIFEYTSPNLFKPLHVGNLLGNIIGESLSRIFEFAGAKVHRVNYPSDIGLSVAKAVWGLKQTGNDPDDIKAVGEAYRYGSEAYENESGENPEAKGEIEAVNRALYASSDAELVALRERGLVTSKRKLNEIMDKLGTKFDNVIYESEVGEVGKKVVTENTPAVFKESEGAVIFPGEDYGLHTRVFINSQGLPTYEAKDMGNFVLKNNLYPNWTEYFVVTGSEQTEYFKVLIEAIKQVFPETRERKLKHVATGFLSLTTGKMSSRKGNVLAGEDLLQEVEEAAKDSAKDSRADDIEALSTDLAVSALKYQILRQGAGSNIVFDKKQALSLSGDSGPYLQYTHARLNSILEKASGLGLKPSSEKAPDHIYDLEKVLYRFPEVVEESIKNTSPHELVTYLTELASTFNKLYEQEQIVVPEDPVSPYKLALCSALRQTLKTGLYLLGLKAVEKM